MDTLLGVARLRGRRLVFAEVLEVDVLNWVGWMRTAVSVYNDKGQMPLRVGGTLPDHRRG